MISNDVFRALLVMALVLIPLIPTFIVYRHLKTRNQARVRGRILGMRIETAGGIASYLACVLIALLAYKLVFAATTAQIQVVVNTSGDPNRIDRFLADA